MKNNQYTATPNWFKDTTTSQTGSQVGQQVTNYYIQGGSSSGGGTIDMSQVWEALAADTTEQINKSHLTDALKDIGLEGDFVDLTSDQDITGIKNFINGLKISDKLINIVDGVLYLDCNVAVTGGLTVYAQGTQDIPSIWDGAPFDNVTIHYNEETGLIEVIGGTGGVSNWEDLQGKPVWITDTAPNNNIFPNTANYWVTDNNKISNWDNAVSKAHEHANKATLDKIYEKDGVIYWDGSLAVTGGITAYALGDVEVSTIMDGVVVDGTTIKKENGKLVVIGGSGSSFDEDAMWTALSSTTNEQINKSHLTTALSEYAIKSELNTSNWDAAYSWGNHAAAGYAKQTALDDVSTKLNDFLEGSDTDTIINKWKELEAFLAGMSETDNLAEILSTKADKSYVDTELTKYVTLATEQTIDGLKHFTNGLTIGATKHKIYEKDGNILIEGNVLVTGGITAYSDGSGSGGSGGGGIDVDVLWEILGGTGTQQINKTHLTNALSGYATESWVTSQNYLTSVNWSQILNKPTTLGGYGITDAYTKTEINNGFIGYGTASASIVNNTNNKPFLYNIEKEDIGIGNGSYYSVLNVGNYSGTNFRSQLAFPYEERITDSEAYIRTANGSIWRPWRKLWHNGNFNPSNYLPLSGGIMTGKLKWNGADSLPQQTGTPKYVLCIDNFSSGGTTKWANRIDILVPSEILSKLKTVDGSSSGLDADLLDGINSTGFCRAYSSSYDFGGSQTNISTAQFITLLTNLGAFNQPYWIAKGSWSYAMNYTITDTGIGNIQLAGATVEVMGSSWAYHIRITTSPTSSNGSVTNSVFIYRNHGDGYSPNWKRIANTTDNVASATKLLNTRTIWGQNFNGEQNVTGDLYLGAGNRIVGKNSVGILKNYDNNNVTLSAAKGDLYIGYDYTDNVRFYSGNNNGTGTEKMTLLSNGNFGIGTTSPSQKLDVNGYTTSDRYIFRTGSSTDVCWNIKNDRIAAGSQIARDVNVGSLLVSNAWADYTKVPTNGIWCKGNIITNSNILATGGVTCYSSDQRAKTVVQHINISLKQIANAPTIRFKWNDWKIKDDGKTHIGGIAQYMQKLLPETVLEADDMLNMDYATTGYVFAVQTAKHLVKTDTEVERLKKRVKKLEKQLKQLGYEEANIISD